VLTLYNEVRAALQDSDFKPKKRLGQNFLIQENVLESILRLLELSPGDKVLEIGSGLGFLTRRLVEKGAEVWAVEVDPFLVRHLTQSPLGSHPGLHLIHGDILKVPLADILPRGRIKVVGNLPYSISTPLLFRLFAWRQHFSTLVLMMQREVAARIASQRGTKAYGTLSVWCQIHGRVVDKVSVSPEAFFPRPKVHSTILRIELYDEPRLDSEETALLHGLVRAAFGQRRKTLVNALTGLFQRSRGEIERLLRDAALDPMRRGETLAVEEFIRLMRVLKQGGLTNTAS
jgi:16S rRNA (adenine1518-N6/adenine1519-N6)-dimethyltransferase